MNKRDLPNKLFKIIHNDELFYYDYYHIFDGYERDAISLQKGSSFFVIKLLEKYKYSTTRNVAKVFCKYGLGYLFFGFDAEIALDFGKYYREIK